MAAAVYRSTDSFFKCTQTFAAEAPGREVESLRVWRLFHCYPLQTMQIVQNPAKIPCLKIFFPDKKVPHPHISPHQVHEFVAVQLKKQQHGVGSAAWVVLREIGVAADLVALRANGLS